MMSLPLTIVTTADRPDLVPIVAEWLWTEFWRQGGASLQTVQDMVQASVSASTMPRTFVLLAGETPIGTASLAADDLVERPDLTPWLAGVFVVPEFRGRGHAARLIAAVEAACRAVSITTLWLYTDTAESVYARAGWRTVETVRHKSKSVPGRSKPVQLMRRDLPPVTSAPVNAGP